MARLRASFQERESYHEVLRKAYSDGRLDDEELERRVVAVEGATYVAELERLVADLPTQRPTVVRAPQSRRKLVVGALGLGVAALGGWLLWPAGSTVTPPASPLTIPPEVTPPEATTPAPTPKRPEIQSLFNHAIAWAQAKGYARVARVSVDPAHPMVELLATTPARPEVTDQLTFRRLEEPEISAGRRAGKTMSWEQVKKIDLETLMQVSRRQFKAPGPVNHISWRVFLNGPEANVYVDNDAYGVGGGRVTWDLGTARITSITRN